MQDWLQQLDVHFAPLAWLATGLLVALLVLLPPEKRPLVRRPIGTFAFYLGLLVVGKFVPTDAIRVLAFACVTLVVFRAALLLATETRPGRWLVPPVPRIFVDVVQFGLYGVVVVLTLHTAGLETGELLTTSALLTAVVGLALQDTLGNVFSGLAMQIGQPFEVGDWIAIDGGQHGRVIEIGWRATKLVTLDDTEIIVPNGVIAKSVVRNFTRPTPVERRRVKVGVEYGTPPERAKAVLVDAVSAVPGVLEDPRPGVVMLDYADSALVFEVRYYLDDHRAAEQTDGRVRERIWYALRRAGIGIPFPQRDLHVHTHDAQEARQRAIDRRDRALSHVALFDVLPAAGHRALAANSEERLYGSDEVIVRQGDKGSQLFVVIEGQVAVLAGHPPDEVARLGPDAFFGEMSLLTGAVRSATVRTVTASRLLVVDAQALAPVLEAHPEVTEQLSKALAERSSALEAHAAREDGEKAPREVEARRKVFLERIRALFPT